MEAQPIWFLVLYWPTSKLKIIVCKIWVTKTIEVDPQAASLDSMFIDE